jgi:hypothetical protein
MTDVHIYKAALLDSLDIPEGKYYLAGAGFPSCKELLIPYHAIQYQLAEWGRCHESDPLFVLVSYSLLTHT